MADAKLCEGILQPPSFFFEISDSGGQISVSRLFILQLGEDGLHLAFPVEPAPLAGRVVEVAHPQILALLNTAAGCGRNGQIGRRGCTWWTAPSPGTKKDNNDHP